MTTEPPIGRLVQRAARLMNRRADARARALGLGAAAFPVLGLLRDGARLPQSELARRLGIEQPSVAQLLARLERDGMIAREPNPGDGRSTLVALTPRATALLPEVDAILADGQAAMLARFTDAEAATLAALLGRLVEGLE